MLPAVPEALLFLQRRPLQPLPVFLDTDQYAGTQKCSQQWFDLIARQDMALKNFI